MTRRLVAPASVALAVVVLLSRLPFSTEFLYSWDSANFAFAMNQIDIAAHWPHPPGYVGYVLAGRALHSFLHDANAALVWWNVIAVILASGVYLQMAREVAAEETHPRIVLAGAISLFVTSPLLWFYSEAAEIYPSELLGTLSVAFCAWRAKRGHLSALYACAVLIPATAFFKLTAALLMLPLAGIVWWGTPPPLRWRSLAVFVLCSGVAIAIVLAVEPGLASIVWEHFANATAGTRVLEGGLSDSLERVNHNARDTLLAGVSMVGIVNAIALAAWALVDRRAPSGLPRGVAVLWATPWIMVCVVVHIGKPGYVLPLLPLLGLLVASLYGRLRPALGIAAVAVQAAVNVAHFSTMGPLPSSLTGGDRPYRSKRLLQRIASDLQPLTFATAATLKQEDAAVRAVLDVWNRLCPRGDGILITDGEPVDARRAMWYLPRSTVVDLEGARVRYIGTAGRFRAVNDETSVAAECPVIWLSDREIAGPRLPTSARREPGVGFSVPARWVRLGPEGIAFGN